VKKTDGLVDVIPDSFCMDSGLSEPVKTQVSEFSRFEKITVIYVKS